MHFYFLLNLRKLKRFNGYEKKFLNWISTSRAVATSIIIGPSWSSNDVDLPIDVPFIAPP